MVYVVVTFLAVGYHGIQKSGDDHLLDDSLNAVRKQVEKYVVIITFKCVVDK